MKRKTAKTAMQRKATEPKAATAFNRIAGQGITTDEARHGHYGKYRQAAILSKEARNPARRHRLLQPSHTGWICCSPHADTRSWRARSQPSDFVGIGRVEGQSIFAANKPRAFLSAQGI